QDDPGVDHGLLNGRGDLEEPGDLIGRTKAHHAFDAGPVVPAAVEDDHLAGGWEVRKVALDVHLGFLPRARRGEGHDVENPWAHPLHDPFDGTALTGGVPTLEHDA